jgi:molybdate transport system substrate-binding protein
VKFSERRAAREERLGRKLITPQVVFSLKTQDQTIEIIHKSPKFMHLKSIIRHALVAGVALVLFAAGASAAEIKVMSSAGFKAAYLELAAEFERTTGHKIVNAWGPSMGDTPQAVPNRITRGEPVDVVIVVGEALDKLIRDGKVIASSRADLARSLIGAAVRSGQPKPDISTVEAFKTALVNAKSIAYSDSASGVYIQTVVYKRLDVSDAVKAKSRMIPADPVGEIVARGDAELGFQQMSELMPVKGIDLIGPIPAEIQKVTVFSAAIAANAKEPEAAAALIKFLSAPAAAPVIKKSGMELVNTAAAK